MWRSMMCLTLLPLSGVALAEDFDYSFVQGSYGRVDTDNLGDGDGFGIAGSFALSGRFHVFGNYAAGDFESDFDGIPFEFEIDTLETGLGFNTPVSDTVDLVASLSYLSFDFNSFDESGYGLGLGLRVMATPAVEVNGGIHYAEVAAFSNEETSLSAGFLYHFSEAFALGVGGEWGEAANSYAVNARFSFGE